mgnify:CR=1 FL=1
MTTTQNAEVDERERWRRATGYWMPAAPQSEPRPDDLLLTQYAPHDHLVVEDHTPLRARFTAINFHVHYQNQDPAHLVAEMNASNVAIAVDMGVGTGWSFDYIHDRFVKPYPDRFRLFASLDWDDLLQHEDFGLRAVQALEQAKQKGAVGLKIWKNVGLTVRLPNGELLAIDDPRLDPLYAKAGELDLPVCFHTVDPPAFHQALDRHNERYAAILSHPNWHVYGPQYPPREAVLEQRNRVIARFPDVTFVGAHMGSDSTDLPRLAQLLEAHPNYHVDLSARIRDVGRLPYSARRFFIKYADRILYGTDGPPIASIARPYFRFLETEDEAFRQHAGQLDYIYGINLPDEVLKKIYYDNAAKILKIS